MLCKKTDQPVDSKTFIWEPKLDGVRCVLEKTSSKVRLFSRSQRDITVSFPDVTDKPHAHDYVLDGEIVSLDTQGVPDFELIQQRIGKTRPIDVRQASRVFPAVYMVFDLLSLDGNSTRGLKLLDRKDLLKEANLPYSVVPYVHGSGKALFLNLVEKGWEGVVGKHINSTYVPGRTNQWVKCKKSEEGTFYVCGVTKGEGNREGLPGALVLGELKGSKLQFVGEVGTGLTFDNLRMLKNTLKRVEISPINGTKISDLWYWCRPEVQVEVTYLERTSDGKLRFPAVKRILWKGAK